MTTNDTSTTDLSLIQPTAPDEPHNITIPVTASIVSILVVILLCICTSIIAIRITRKRRKRRQQTSILEER